jgi:hypothetical protein
MLVGQKLYGGRYQLRSSHGLFYFHVPLKIVESFGTRRVRVTAMVNADTCNDKKYNGSVFVFRAMLIYVGGTIRIRIPSRYADLCRSIMDCGSIDVWLEPLPETIWGRRGRG